MTAAAPNLPAIPPRTAIGDYRVLERFASGGMGDIYRVVNPLLREVFAMKVLREAPGAPGRGESVERFFEEARTTVRLRHGNIVTLHTMGLEPTSGRLYFIMDYIGLSPQRRAQILGEGPWFADLSAAGADAEAREPMSLEELLAARGPVPEKILRILAADVAAALDHAHRAGVVHCDLKPANILLREDGHAVVGDFGIARVFRAAAQSGAASGSSILGTPHYMAPEQRSGSATLTPAADIYAYGVTFYRLLTGRYPEGVWKRPSELGFSPAWDRLCQNCLARNPADRWPSMRRIHAYLQMMPELTRRLQSRRRAGRLLSLVRIALPAVALLAAGILVVRQSLRLSGTDRPVMWITVHPTPEAFVKGDVARAEVRPEAAGMLAYDAAAPAELPLPPFPLEHINRLALPETTRALPPGFGDRFPRLEYIICAPGNPVFFAQDGILYRRDDPSRPALLPPRLFGAITLPMSVTDFPHPWPEASTTATTLRSNTGAYGRVLFLRAHHPVRWLTH